MLHFAFLLLAVSLSMVSVRGSSYYIQAIHAKFKFKSYFGGVWVDSLGMVYFSMGNKYVQSLSPAGDTAVIIGPSLKNSSGISAPATSVQLDGCVFLHGDTSGNLYISGGAFFIWKYDRSSGIVSRIAGAIPATQSFSGDGGQAPAAHLNGPHGMFLSSNGVLFFADYYNHRIRTINTSTGIIDTFAGNGANTFAGDLGPATSASLFYPTSVWGSSDGVMYIADAGNRRIRQVDMSGIITTLAGNGETGYNGDNIPATSAKMSVSSINADADGNILFTDPVKYRVRMIKDGMINTIAGNGKEGGYSYSIQAADTSIPYPTILGRDPTTGVIYFTAQASAIMLSTVLTARPTNAPTIKPTGAPSTASPSLQFPERGSYYYVQTIIDGSKQWPYFSGIWVDSVGTAYITRASGVTVQTLTTAGKTSVIIGPKSQDFSGVSAVQLYGLSSITGDTLGNLYISGVYFIWKYDRSSGIVSRIAGALPASVGFSGDGGQATAANLNYPQGLFLSSNGVLFFADSGNSVIRTINTAIGIIHTFAGNGAGSYTGDGGPSTSASLSYPTSVWGSSDGVIYIADYGNRRIREVDTSGMIRTFAGNGNDGYNGEYIPATLSGLSAISICGDSTGNIFVAEPLRYRVRVIKGGFVHTIAGNGGDNYYGEASVIHTLKLANTSIPQPGQLFCDPPTGVIYYTSWPTVNKLVPPAIIPTETPTITPTSTPSYDPTETPTITPTSTPSYDPTETPTITPTSTPSYDPTETPTITPTSPPSYDPTETPTIIPTSTPSYDPTETPTFKPSFQLTSLPSSQSSFLIGQPTSLPTFSTYHLTENVNLTIEYTFASINGIQLNNVNVLTITTVIEQVVPKPSTVVVQSFTRIDDGNSTSRRFLTSSGRVEIESGRGGGGSKRYYRYRVVANIIFNLINFPGQDASTVAATKTKLMKEVGTNGSFVEALHELALVNNATQLFNTTVEGVNVTHSVVPPPSTSTASDGDSSHTAHLTNGQIAGLIVGCMVGSGCCFSILYFLIVSKCMNNRKSSNNNNTPAIHYNDCYVEKEFEGGCFDDIITITVGGVDSGSSHQMAKRDGEELSL